MHVIPGRNCEVLLYLLSSPMAKSVDKSGEGKATNKRQVAMSHPTALVIVNFFYSIKNGMESKCHATRPAEKM